MRNLSFMKALLFLFAPLALVSLASLHAETYYVDVTNGTDAHPGTKELAFKTTAKAIKAAQPGDTIVILKVEFPIQETISIRNKSGEPGRPMTIDGNDNLFTGSDPLKPEDWTKVQPGVFRNNHLVKGLTPGNTANASTLQSYFMLWNGVQNRMGRSSKGFQTPLPTLDQLNEGQWTYVDAETAFYIAIDPGKNLEDYKIENPVRMNVVEISGTCSHWIIRNINTTHAINDGFNMHGHMEDFVFENITSTECGDDGISAHENSEITIRGFVSRRNSTGICHAGTVTSVNEGVVLEDNYGGNLLLGNGTHTFKNSTVSAKAPADGKDGIRLFNEPQPGSDRVLTVDFIDCKIPFPQEGTNANGRPAFRVGENVKLQLSGNTKPEGPITSIR